MQPDMMRQLQQLQRQAAQVGQLVQDLAAATPQWSEGSDATGWVRIVLGRDLLPTEIRVRDGWQQRLEPERLGSAVLDASRDAVRHAMEALTDELDRGRWWMRRADVDAAAGQETAHGAPSPPVPSHGQVRDMNDMAEEVLTALQAAQRQATAPPPPPPDQEADERQPVTVEIGPNGLTACEIDPDWAVRRGGAAVSAALSRALQRAKAMRPAVSSPRVEIDSLVEDALATLTSFTRLPTTEGGDR